jgi:hypothetical protein
VGVCKNWKMEDEECINIQSKTLGSRDHSEVQVTEDKIILKLVLKVWCEISSRIDLLYIEN